MFKTSRYVVFNKSVKNAEYNLTGNVSVSLTLDNERVLHERYRASILLNVSGPNSLLATTTLILNKENGTREKLFS